MPLNGSMYFYKFLTIDKEIRPKNLLAVFFGLLEMMNDLDHANGVHENQIISFSGCGIFHKYLKTYDEFMAEIQSLGRSWHFDDDELFKLLFRGWVAKNSSLFLFSIW